MIIDTDIDYTDEKESAELREKLSNVLYELNECIAIKQKVCIMCGRLMHGKNKLHPNSCQRCYVQYLRKRRRRDRECLTDNYIKKILADNKGITRRYITEDLVNLQRASIAAKREIKKHKSVLD